MGRSPESAVTVAENRALANIEANIFPELTAAVERAKIPRVITSVQNSVLKAGNEFSFKNHGKKAKNYAEAGNHSDFEIAGAYRDQIEEKRN